MRQSFDSWVPLAEQISRRIKVHTGHKHQHRPGPGKPRKQQDPRIVARLHKYNARVAAYFRGEIDECP